jgi:hypothetical protein
VGEKEELEGNSGERKREKYLFVCLFLVERKMKRRTEEEI